MEEVLVEIRAGAGGEEAALFCRDLFRMYSKYALSKNWKVEVIEERYSDLGGFKQIVFKVKGEHVYENLKYEGGVHRVQRVPKTEKSNRIHTSTASVAVLKVPKETEITINPNDLEFDYYKASGPGGQYVNKRQTAVRVTHLPTGITVSSQVSRNLEENRKMALSILKAKLYEKQKEEINQELSQERKSQIGWSERAEKIRTYNFPQDRITDHRISRTWHNIEKILDGDLDKVIKKLKEKLK